MGSSGLCARCGNLNLREMLEGGGNQERVPLGILKEAVKQQTRCNLWFLLAEAIRKGCNGRLPQNDKDVQCFLEGSSRHSLEVHTEPDMPTRYCGEDIAVVADETRPEIEWRSSLKLLGEKVNFDMIRTWHRLCCERHATRCSNPSWLRVGDPASLSVIDVEERTVIDAPLSCVYVALSYIWGDPQMQVMAKQKDIERLSRRAFQLPKLPATVEDAILVTKELGIRYLWVDAVCIVQTPPTNQYKVHQLRQMDRIFKSAEVAIVAAGSENASDRIPGICSRQNAHISPVIDGIHCAFELPTSENDMWTHKRFQRAWTFQELALSRRAIVFGKRSASWLCKCDSWNESTSRPADLEKASFGWPHLPDTSMPPERVLPMSFNNDWNQMWYDTSHDPKHNVLYAYTQMVTCVLQEE